MFRLTLSVVIGVSLLGTLACDGSNKKEGFQKVLGGVGPSGAFGERVKTINEASGKSGCLRVDDLIEALRQAEDNEISIYVSNVDLGSSQTASEMDFAASEDRALTADVVLRGLQVSNKLSIAKPTEMRSAGNALNKTLLGTYIRDAELNEDCSQMKLRRSKNSEPIAHPVVHKGSDILRIQNPDTQELIEYKFNKTDELQITTYRSTKVEKVCDKVLPPLVKTTFTVALREEAAPISIARSFAELLVMSLQNSDELSGILEDMEKGQDVLELNSNFYSELIQNIQDDKFSSAKCAR